MDNYVLYSTKGGVRFDQISTEMYGSPFYVADIIRANTDVPITPILPDGYVLKIPVKDSTAVQLSSDVLPLWKK